MVGVYISIILAISLSGKNGLKLKRDFFFIFFILQGIIYTFVIPMIAVDKYGPVVQTYYVEQQYWILMAFFAPMILLYRWMVSRVQCRAIAFEPMGRHTVLLWVAFLILFEVLFLHADFETGLIFRRIGTYEAAERQASLSLWDLGIIRSHDFAVLPILGYLMAIQSRFHFSDRIGLPARRILLTTMLFIGIVYFMTLLFNSRLMLTLGSIYLFGVWVVFSGTPIRRIYNRLLIILVVIGAGMIITFNLRYFNFAHDPLWKVFDPTYSFKLLDHADKEREWVDRLDGIFLMQALDSGGLKCRGYVLGDAWEIPVKIILAQFMDPQQSQEYKRTGLTTAKSYLMERYTDLVPGDAPSCLLTDVYGNFGVMGFLLAAFFSAGAYALLTHMIFRGGNQTVLIAMFLLMHIMVFEMSFIEYLIGWVRWMPVLGVLLIINTVHFLYPMKGMSWLKLVRTT